MRFYILVGVMLLFPIIAEGNYNQSSANWRGKSAHELAKFGSPKLVSHLPDGNTIYVFMLNYTKIYPLPPVNNPTVIVGPKGQAIAASLPPSSQPISTPQCVITVEVNKEKVIINMRQEGNCRN